MTSSYNPDHRGVGILLESDMLLDVVTRVAELIRDRAITLSPVGTVLEGDEHPGEYISSFHIRSHVFGGAKSDRAEAIVYNDASDAVYVEFGSYGQEPYHVLRRAANEVTI